MPSSTILAFLGGEPTFATPLAMASPRLPDPDSLLPDFREIISSGQLTKGKHLQRFESESAHYLGVEHCIGVSSCTSGLMLCLQALRRRLPPGKSGKVAVPSFTFLASISAIVWAGLEPVFVDVDPATMNICLQDLEKTLETNDIDAVLAVHCFGNPVPHQTVEELCQRHKVKLMFDAAHGFGSIHTGEKVGKAGWCQIFSLTPTKMVVAGEGGLIGTQDEALRDELVIAREYGNDGTYDTVFPGINARLSELHAALACASLELLEEVVAHRNKVALALLNALGGIEGIGFQQLTSDSRSTYKDFTITICEQRFGVHRDLTAAALEAEGVPSRKYFSPPCHQHRAFQQYSTRELPGTKTLADQCLSIPLLNLDTVEQIASAFAKIQQQSVALNGTLKR